MGKEIQRLRGPNHCHAVVFDFDYTLADSSRPVWDCINTALAGIGLASVSREETNRTIGLSLPETFLKLAGREHAAKAGEFVERFVRRADEIMVEQTVLFDSVEGMVAQLQPRGVRLGIVSTKYRRRIEAILEREGLRRHFAAVVGGDDVARQKPDPEGLRLALGHLGAQPEEGLYVGDSLPDAEAAQQAGVRFVAVFSGMTPREAFAAFPVAGFLPDVSHLPEYLFRGRKLSAKPGRAP